MIIRSYNKADFPDIATIYARSKLDELKFEDAPFTLLPLEQDKRRLKRFKSSTIFVAVDPRIIGYGACIGNEIRALYVDPDARGCGAGTKILQYLLSYINSPARLCVAKSNTPAKNLYCKFGFTVVGEFKSSYNGKPVVVSEMAQPVQ